MDLCVFEYDPPFVLEHFREGEFDYLDAASEVEETEFFRYIGAQKILAELAESYPTPRQKEEVPLWMYVASNLSMRLHGVHSFHAYPYVVRCGGMLQAFGPEVAHKSTHPESRDLTLACAGFNHKNTYDRETPCDQDFLRKLARDTPPEALHRWFNHGVIRVFKRHHAFDPEGIFLGDASYLFVPDNERYEGSVRLLFDEHHHPVESAKLSAEQRARCTWKRCYKLVSLLHIDRQGDFFLYAALAVVSGKAQECPVLYELVEGFIEAAGVGVINRLILDRGFLDGERIGHLKQDYGIDVLIPLRRGMDLYEDALGLVRGGEVAFQPYSPAPVAPPTEPRAQRVAPQLRPREARRQATLAAKKAQQPPPDPSSILLRSEVARIEGFESWTSCPVPVAVVVNREFFADGHEQIWMLLDTGPPAEPTAARRDYGLRTGIEERHRQLKCFWDLTDFRSRALSLVVNQVVFVALAYSLLQLYLRRTARAKRNRQTLPRLRDQLLPTDSVIILYYENRYALLSPLQYTELLLTLAPEASAKILAKTRRLRRELAEELHLPRPP